MLDHLHDGPHRCFWLVKLDIVTALVRNQLLTIGRPFEELRLHPLPVVPLIESARQHDQRYRAKALDGARLVQTLGDTPAFVNGRLKSAGVTEYPA